MISVKRETKEVMQTIRSFIKWVLIAHLTGAAGGLVGSAFHLSVSRHRFLHGVPVEGVPAQDRR